MMMMIKKSELGSQMSDFRFKFLKNVDCFVEKNGSKEFWTKDRHNTNESEYHDELSGFQ